MKGKDESSAHPSYRDWRSLRADLNGANVAAGVTAGLWYAFGAIPIQLGAAASFDLTPEAASSWFFIIWFTGAVSSILFTLRYRQPLAITWTIPGLVFLATVSDLYTLPEIAGASLAAGIMILALGFLGVGARLMRWLPLPIVMGMFVGSILGYATGIFEQLGAQPWVVGAAIVGYLGARGLGRTWLPPVGGAVVAGLAAAAVAGQVHPEAFRWSLPAVVPLVPAFDPGSLLAVSVPLVVMAIGIGNVQGLGMLVNQGYRPPTNLLTIVMGINSIINAVFGGHPSTVARNGVAILAGDDAGPRDQRYVANLIASLFALFLALSAMTASALLEVFPISLVASLAGLAILSVLMDALQKTVATDLRLGAFFALIIAASPFTILGIGSAFWALVGGFLVSLLLERPALAQILRAG
jgi:benzoate membrane transport protein